MTQAIERLDIRHLLEDLGVNPIVVAYRQAAQQVTTEMRQNIQEGKAELDRAVLYAGIHSKLKELNLLSDNNVSYNDLVYLAQTLGNQLDANFFQSDQYAFLNQFRLVTSLVEIITTIHPESPKILYEIIGLLNSHIVASTTDQTEAQNALRESLDKYIALLESTANRSNYFYILQALANEVSNNAHPLAAKLPEIIIKHVNGIDDPYNRLNNLNLIISQMATQAPALLSNLLSAINTTGLELAAKLPNYNNNGEKSKALALILDAYIIVMQRAPEEQPEIRATARQQLLEVTESIAKEAISPTADFINILKIFENIINLNSLGLRTTGDDPSETIIPDVAGQIVAQFSAAINFDDFLAELKTLKLSSSSEFEYWPLAKAIGHAVGQAIKESLENANVEQVSKAFNPFINKFSDVPQVGLYIVEKAITALSVTSAFTEAKRALNTDPSTDITTLPTEQRSALIQMALWHNEYLACQLAMHNHRLEAGHDFNAALSSMDGVGPHVQGIIKYGDAVKYAALRTTLYLHAAMFAETESRDRQRALEKFFAAAAEDPANELECLTNALRDTSKYPEISIAICARLTQHSSFDASFDGGNVETRLKAAEAVLVGSNDPGQIKKAAALFNALIESDPSMKLAGYLPALKNIFGKTDTDSAEFGAAISLIDQRPSEDIFLVLSEYFNAFRNTPSPDALEARKYKARLFAGLYVNRKIRGESGFALIYVLKGLALSNNNLVAGLARNNLKDLDELARRRPGAAAVTGALSALYTPR